MYITNFICSLDPFDPSSGNSFAFNLHEMRQMQLTNQNEVAGVVKIIEDACDIALDWESLVHNDNSRDGSIEFRLLDSPQDAAPHRMFWFYSALDDPDLAEFIELPVNHRKEIIGVLTPEQIEKFWNSINPDYEPIGVLTDLLRRFHLTPADLDEFDVIVMRKVIAIQWWRAFPSVTEGEAALDLKPDLTAHVDAFVTTTRLNEAAEELLELNEGLKTQSMEFNAKLMTDSMSFGSRGRMSKKPNKPSPSDPQEQS